MLRQLERFSGEWMWFTSEVKVDVGINALANRWEDVRAVEAFVCGLNVRGEFGSWARYMVYAVSRFGFENSSGALRIGNLQ